VIRVVKTPKLSIDFGKFLSRVSRTQASDIGVPSAENVDFVVIQTYLSFGF
jgi:hypothetical protein